MLCRSLFVLFLLVIVLSVLLQTLLQFYRGGRVPLVEQKLLTLSEHISTPGFKWGSRYSIFSFMFNVCRSLFVLLYFFFWPLCCLSFFDLRIMITSLWYLQISYTSIIWILQEFLEHSFENANIS